MFAEADKFAEELRQLYKSAGAPDELAQWCADSWLDSFRGMYEATNDDADGIEQIDRMRAILRLDIPIKEKIAKLDTVYPMPKRN